MPQSPLPPEEQPVPPQFNPFAEAHPAMPPEGVQGVPQPQPMPEQAVPPQGVPGDGGVHHFPDGSVVIMPPPSPEPERPAVPENLALVLHPRELSRIGFMLKKAIEEDADSQMEYFQSVADILKLLGIQAIQRAESGLPRGGTQPSMNVYSPALFETLLDLTATIMSSIWPGKSPISCQILGESTQDLENAAIRKTAFFNAWVHLQDKGFSKELRRIVVWSILTGSTYAKVYIDSVMGRPTMRMIKPQDFIINRDLSSHLSAIRKTQVHVISKKEYMMRQRAASYRSAPIQAYDADSDNPIFESLREISASAMTGSSSDEASRMYRLYECHIETAINGVPGTEPDMPLPYVVVLDAESGEVLSITQNWNESDPLKRKRECFVNFSFLPSLDGEGYGLLQTSGRAAQTSTEILRELIVAGSYASMPAGFINSSSIKKDKSIVSPRPGEFTDLQTNVPVSQIVAPLPFREPSPQLFELKNQLEDAIRRPSAIINHKVSDMNANAPMGSTLALLESLQKIPNFVLQGYHQSFGEVLSLLNECFYDWLPPQQQYPFKVPGQNGVMMRADFEPHLQVIPSTDPTLQNSTFRMMRAQMILENALKAPELHNLRNVEEVFYRSLGVPEEEVNQLLKPPPEQVPPPPPPPAMDPVSENGHILGNQPVKAYMPQDHQAHMIVHKSLLQNPDVSQNPELMGAIHAHIYEHIALQQQQELMMKANIQLPGDPTQLPMQAQNQIAAMAAQVLQQEQEQQNQQPSPDVLNAQAAMVAAEAEQQMVQVKSQQAQLEAQVKQAQLELEHRKLALEEHKVQMDQSNKAQKLQLDETVAQGKDARDAAKTDLELRKGEADLMERSQNMAQSIQLP